MTGKKEDSYTKDTTLGIDAGYSKIGFSAVTDNKELISGKMELRNDISKKLDERKKYRRQRRHRNTRYREPRFDNRTKEEGGVVSSFNQTQKKNTHIRLVKKIKKLLPIDETVVEVANFDQQKMKNPEISGVKYQQGTLQGYNVKNYLLEKFDYECAYCSKSDVPLEVEHITPKSRGGSDRVSNLTISCVDCNQEKGQTNCKRVWVSKDTRKSRRILEGNSLYEPNAVENSQRTRMQTYTRTHNQEEKTGRRNRKISHQRCFRDCWQC
ncbi:hypothetical protein C9439_01890 [archaeon SCG-AAA382B04]|nr:hypothetical protein C9439_08080 [archaeon SCG-AAA382B04]PTD94592.1 hypothetical protein C9439_01890 [archaeon SCG-AAA382B04]